MPSSAPTRITWTQVLENQVSLHEWSVIEGELGEPWKPSSKVGSDHCGKRNVSFIVTCESEESAQHLAGTRKCFGIGYVSKLWRIENTAHTLDLTCGDSVMQTGHRSYEEGFTVIRFKPHAESPGKVFDRLSQVILSGFVPNSKPVSVSGKTVSFNYQADMYVVRNK